MIDFTKLSEDLQYHVVLLENALKDLSKGIEYNQYGKKNKDIIQKASLYITDTTEFLPSEEEEYIYKRYGIDSDDFIAKNFIENPLELDTSSFDKHEYNRKRNQVPRFEELSYDMQAYIVKYEKALQEVKANASNHSLLASIMDNMESCIRTENVSEEKQEYLRRRYLYEDIEGVIPTVLENSSIIDSSSFDIEKYNQTAIFPI